MIERQREVSRLSDRDRNREDQGIENERHRVDDAVVQRDRPANHVLFWVPPLCITKDDVNEIVSALDHAIGEIEDELSKL